MTWPDTLDELVAMQSRLAGRTPSPYRLEDDAVVGGCFVCFGRGESGAGSRGDPAWTAAASWFRGALAGTATTRGRAGGPYRPGFLALREGPLLEGVCRRLTPLPDVLLVNATGRDHPRRAGLALHLGAVLGIPTVGVTHRPLLAAGDPPTARRGSVAPLLIEDDLVGYRVRTVDGVLPLSVTAAWQTDPDTAVEVVLAVTKRHRTPQPLRQARRLARTARSRRPSAFHPGFE